MLHALWQVSKSVGIACLPYSPHMQLYTPPPPHTLHTGPVYVACTPHTHRTAHRIRRAPSAPSHRRPAAHRPQGGGLLRPLITAATEGSVSSPLRKPAQHVLAQLQISDDELGRAAAELRSRAPESATSADLEGEVAQRQSSARMELMRQVG